MSKRRLLQIGLGTVTIGLLVYLYLNREEPVVTYNWETHFKHDSQDPYGTYLLHELLKKGRGDSFEVIKSPINSLLNDPELANTSYLFIGKSWYYSDDDFVALADYVSRGNDAYILCKEAPYSILHDIGLSSLLYFGTERKRKSEMRIGESEVKLDYVTDWENRAYYWAYADSVISDDVKVLGGLEGPKFNYFKVGYGQGSFYFHLTPLAFTNFNLRNERTWKYANQAFKEMREGSLYWDAFSQLPYSEGEVAKSPLVFILSTESLRWAWYLLVALAVCYLLFYTRRRQRPIPVLVKPENTSLGFAKTISSMYFQQKSNEKIVRHQFNAFTYFVRTKYGLWYQQGDESYLKKLSLKASISFEDVSGLVRDATTLQSRESVANEELISFNKAMESFYNKCK